MSYTEGRANHSESMQLTSRASRHYVNEIALEHCLLVVLHLPDLQRLA